jgi:hypothetical protein
MMATPADQTVTKEQSISWPTPFEPNDTYQCFDLNGLDELACVLELCTMRRSEDSIEVNRKHHLAVSV